VRGRRSGHDDELQRLELSDELRDLEPLDLVGELAEAVGDAG
jgi:hypothetical protein